MKIRQSLLVTTMLCVLVLSAPSQQKKEANKSADEDVIKVNANLVSLDVIVKDRKGKAITDLKPEDFTVLENGVPQKIEFFDSTLTSNGQAAQPASASIPNEPGPRTSNGYPRNIIALVLDGQSTEGANLKHVREGMMKYIRERISDKDSVGLFSISGGLEFLQPFTQDKAKLIAAVEKAYGSSTVSKDSQTTSAQCGSK
jgi:VWFA-related protein